MDKIRLSSKGTLSLNLSRQFTFSKWLLPHRSKGVRRKTKVKPKCRYFPESGWKAFEILLVSNCHQLQKAGNLFVGYGDGGTTAAGLHGTE